MSTVFLHKACANWTCVNQNVWIRVLNWIKVWIHKARNHWHTADWFFWADRIYAWCAGCSRNIAAAYCRIWVCRSTIFDCKARSFVWRVWTFVDNHTFAHKTRRNLAIVDTHKARNICRRRHINRNITVCDEPIVYAHKARNIVFNQTLALIWKWNRKLRKCRANNFAVCDDAIVFTHKRAKGNCAFGICNCDCGDWRHKKCDIFQHRAFIKCCKQAKAIAFFKQKVCPKRDCVAIAIKTCNLRIKWHKVCWQSDVFQKDIMRVVGHCQKFLHTVHRNCIFQTWIWINIKNKIGWNIKWMCVLSKHRLAQLIIICTLICEIIFCVFPLVDAKRGDCVAWNFKMIACQGCLIGDWQTLHKLAQNFIGCVYRGDCPPPVLRKRIFKVLNAVEDFIVWFIIFNCLSKRKLICKGERVANRKPHKRAICARDKRWFIKIFNWWIYAVNSNVFLQNHKVNNDDFKGWAPALISYAINNVFRIGCDFNRKALLILAGRCICYIFWNWKFVLPINLLHARRVCFKAFVGDFNLHLVFCKAINVKWKVITEAARKIIFIGFFTRIKGEEHCVFHHNIKWQNIFCDCISGFIFKGWNHKFCLGVNGGFWNGCITHEKARHIASQNLLGGHHIFGDDCAIGKILNTWQKHKIVLWINCHNLHQKHIVFLIVFFVVFDNDVIIICKIWIKVDFHKVIIAAWNLIAFLSANLISVFNVIIIFQGNAFNILRCKGCDDC